MADRYTTIATVLPPRTARTTLHLVLNDDADPASPPTTAFRAALQAVTRNGAGGLVGPDGQWHDRASTPTPLPEGAVVARPPGSVSELGACALRVARAGNARLVLLDALSAAHALACTQTDRGGWAQWAQPARACGGPLSPAQAGGAEAFDDGTMAAALYFLMDLRTELNTRDLPAPGWLDKAAEALDRLPGCQFFEQPLAVTKFLDFVDRILAGEFDHAKSNGRPRRQLAKGRL